MTDSLDRVLAFAEAAKGYYYTDNPVLDRVQAADGNVHYLQLQDLHAVLEAAEHYEDLASS